MKHYLVFKSDSLYPNGGWHDFDSAHDDIEAAESRRQQIHAKDSISHIVDIKTEKIIISQ